MHERAVEWAFELGTRPNDWFHSGMISKKGCSCRILSFLPSVAEGVPLVVSQ